MSNRRKTAKLAPWIPMDRHQYKSAAFAALSAVAQAMLVHLTYNYNSKMMNSVSMSARLGAKKLNISKTSAAKTLLELEHYGFIVKVQGAYLGVSGVGKSAHYRLTAQRYGNLGATHDYDKWDGEIFSSKKQNPVRLEGQCVRLEGHKGRIRKLAKMEQVSAQRDISNPPDCPPRGTYLVEPSSRQTIGPAHAPIGHNAGPPLVPEPAKMEWTKPELTEIEYKPALRRLYRDTEPTLKRARKLAKQFGYVIGNPRAPGQGDQNDWSMGYWLEGPVRGRGYNKWRRIYHETMNIEDMVAYLERQPPDHPRAT